MNKLITKFTNVSGMEFEVRYDGKVLATVGAGETIDLPTPEARAGAKALANKVMGQRADFSDWNKGMIKLQAEILNEAAEVTSADVDSAPDITESADPVEPKADYSKMTGKDLVAVLDEKGIPYPKGAKKADLLDLLENPPAPVEDKEEGEEEFPEDASEDKDEEKEA